MASSHEPGYITLHRTGELASRIEKAYNLLRGCRVCPRECGPDRTKDEKGFYRTGLLPHLASYGPHFGEEPPLVGLHGSGTIFFTNCNLACEFCQNYDISQGGGGREVPCETVSDAMIDLQHRGCHNINLVSPSHIVPHIIRSIAIAAENGLHIPVVYNSGGYDSVESLRLLDGIIDIYMPDAKYGCDETALALSHAPHYVGSMKAAISEMHRQVGNLEIHDGIATHGMIIRHLVLPENLAGSDIVLPWIAKEISKDSYVNIMAQYHWPLLVLPPERIRGDARFRSLLRPITPEEYRFAIRCAEKAGLHRGWK